MQAQTRIRIAEKKQYHPFFTRLEQYFHDAVIDGMNVNEYIESFGKPGNMSPAVAVEIAAAMSQAAQESAWKYYAVKPDPAAFKNPPSPKDLDIDSIPPKRHFLLCLTQPGITPAAVVAAIDITANAIRTGKLMKGMALEVDALARYKNRNHQFLLDNAIGNLFRAIGIGNQNAMAERRSYRYCSIRFHAGTLNDECIDLFSASLASGEFPANFQIRLSAHDLACAGRLMFARPDYETKFPAELSIAFMGERTSTGATSHRTIHTVNRCTPEASDQMEIDSPLANSIEEITLPPDALAIDEQLERLRQLYSMKLDSRSLEHQLRNLQLLQDSKPIIRFQ